VVTPIQLGNAVATMANRGVPHVPHLLRAAQSGIDRKVELVDKAAALPSVNKKPDNWLAIEQGMIAVVSSGTGRGVNDGFPYVIAGKTGTAERYSRTDETWTSISSGPIERHQVLFEAFTPADDARIAVAVALEAGRSGAHDAAPIARKILDAWLPGDREAQGNLLGARAPAPDATTQAAR
jgi:penicillin-binding protein 2